MAKLKVIIIGLGAMGKIATKFLVGKGAEIVGAIGHSSNIGKDVGEIAELGYPLGIKLSNNADEVLSQNKADIAVICVASSMKTMFPIFKQCIEHNLNVITIAEEALYPWIIAPQHAAELDQLAKEHGVTISASGLQDVFWVNLTAVLTGASNTIEEVRGTVTANLDAYGPLLLHEEHIGEFPDAIVKPAESTVEENIQPFKIGLEALIAYLGLTIKEESNRKEPMLAKDEVESKGLGRKIQKGQIIGQSYTDEVITNEGIKFIGQLNGMVLPAGESETNSWIIKGTPELYLENRKMPGNLATCSVMINRIPDIINSQPGYITVDRLPAPKYKIF